MSETLSVVIATKNSVLRLQETVEPWLFAQEVIVADQMSTDGTAELAQKLGCRLIQNEAMGGNFDLNRKLAMQKAVGQWVLYIDTDERPTAALIEEIKDFLKNPPVNVNGAKIPNRFYFLGKSLKYGIYNPRSAEVRLVRQSHWVYPCEEGLHRGLSVRDGEVVLLKNPYKHFNVNSLGEWFIKTNQYTECDAQRTHKRTWSVLSGFIVFFVKHYFFKLGFLDGYPGFLSVWYFGMYHFTLSAKNWEKDFLKSRKEGEDFLKPLSVPDR